MFVFIIALLLLILVVFPDKDEPVVIPAVDDLETPDVGADESEQVVVQPDGPVRPEKPIFIVIDDVGNSLTHLDYFLDLPVDVTFALMPGRPYTEESARRIERAGFDMILHQPMEPEGGQDPGVGAILTGMTAEEIHVILQQNLAGLPEVVGINNHMGSKATADAATMKAVMAYLDSKKMFFLDSVTTDKSVAEAAAASRKVPYARRTALFLDNDSGKSQVEKAFASGVNIASTTGEVVMIGHLKTAALAAVVMEQYKDLMDRGFSFRGMSEYFAVRSR